MNAHSTVILSFLTSYHYRDQTLASLLKAFEIFFYRSLILIDPFEDYQLRLLKRCVFINYEYKNDAR
jgi:hypothetical protein